MNQELERFRAHLNENAGTQKRIRAGENPVEVARELGFDVSGDDFASALKDRHLELTEFELEMVAGGAELKEASDSGKAAQLFGIAGTRTTEAAE